MGGGACGEARFLHRPEKDTMPNGIATPDGAQGPVAGCHLRTGDAEALEACLCDQVAAMRKRSPLAPLYLVVPTRRLGQRLEVRLLDTLGTLVNVHTMTPDTLSEWMGRGGVPPLGPHASRFLVSRAIRETLDDRSCFAPLRNHALLVGMLWRAARDCEAAGATPEQLRLAAVAVDPPRGRTLADLARFIASLRDLESPEGRHDGAYAGKVAGPTLAFPDADTIRAHLEDAAGVIFHGFDLPPIELVPVLRALGGVSVPVLVCAPQRSAWVLEPERADPAHRWLLPHAAVTALDPGGEQAPTLAHLTAYAFAPPGTAPPFEPDPDALQVISAPDPASEIRAVISEILALREEGVPFDHILLTFRRGADYATIVDELFTEYGVPFQADLELPLPAIPVVRTIRLLLSLVRSSLPPADTMELLTSPWFHPDAYLDPGAPRPDVFSWDRLARTAALRFDDPRWRERLDVSVARESGQDVPATPSIAARSTDLRVQAALFERTITELANDMTAVPEMATASTYVRLVKDIIDRLIAPALPGRNGFDAFRALLEELSSLDRVSERLEWETFLALLDDACSSCSIPMRTGDARGVRIIELPSLAGTRADHVFVAGMVSSLFPCPDPQDPVLSMLDRVAINQAGAAFPVQDPAMGEKCLFLDAARAARKRLTLTLHRTDSIGRERLPSGFIREVWRAFFGSRVFAKDFEGHRPFFREIRHHPAGVGNWARRWEMALVQRARESDPPGKAALTLAAWLHHDEDMAAAFRAEHGRWASPQFTAFDGVIGAGWRDTSRYLRLSASQVELAASCPFRYLVSRLWRLEPLPPAGGERTASARDRGTLYHEILHELLARARVHGTSDPARAPGPPQDARDAASVVDQKLNDFERTHPTGHPALWAVEREQIQRDVREFLRLEATSASRFRPFKLEESFGPSREDGAGALRLHVSGLGEIEISGRLDRLDIDPKANEARVIDYKTGKPPSRSGLIKSLKSGRRVQPALYLEAARSFLPPGYEVVGFYYYHVTELAGGFRMVGVTTGEMEEFEHAVQNALLVVGGIIRDGAFFPWPDVDACRFCHYDLVCRRSPLARFKHKATDPHAAEFLALRDDGQGRDSP